MNKTSPLTDLLPVGDLSRGVGQKLTKEQRDLQRIERMTLAAFELFTEHGYQNTTIEALCTQANVSTRDFYKLIKTRESLLARVYVRVFEHVETCIAIALENAEGLSSSARVDTAVDAWVHAYTNDHRYARLSYIEIIGVSDALEKLRHEAHQRFSALIHKELANQSRDPSQIMNGKLPLAIVGACNELILNWLSQSPRPNPESLADEVKEMYRIILAGLDATGPK
ncbi:TetR/AcrR family transcriptional regulator [Microbulbifer sp. YPW1]|uniref:TetR/AcrR family transcriptional regulator n=1 Tax=Microbulbifer sp. YPW1 TaxID=2745199 RepID=UPI0015971F3C|nr:TetR/AcrR family transcriptional regulator [Microbulbifer sp. YPW1]QKX17203.1 TetR/AcrR family transcriptional regulator [Microbulbifer sp. YPW1]